MDERIEPASALDTNRVLESWNTQVAAGAATSADSAAKDAPRSYRAVFFDLDGTLLPMELEEFLGPYFKSIAAFVGKHGLDMQSFSAGLKAGTGAMASHDGSVTNSQAYWDEFFRHVDRDAVEWESLLSGYYEDDFSLIGKDVKPNPAAARAVETLASKGYTLALTTMPMFPRRAVEWRLEWAGIDPKLFSRLTTYENSTAVKPKTSYYAENLAACGLSGEDVLMVGNNTVEDLAAMKLGVDAFLVTDHVLDAVDFDLSSIKHGTMEEFAAWVESLPVCENPVREVETGVVSAQATADVIAANCVKTSASDGVEA